MNALVSPAFTEAAGLWLGLLVSLMIFSLVVGDNRLARLAQYILVGAGLAYALVLAWRSVLLPRLFVPLQETPGEWRLWLPLILGVLLIIAGIERTVRSATTGGGRTLFQFLGALPLALMVGVALSVGMIGAFQGTFLPQFMRAVATGFQWSAPVDVLVNGILGLLITTGVLVHLRSRQSLLQQQPGALRGLLQGWAWIGQRGLWLATGLIFARLLLSRLTLLIAEFEFLIGRLQQTGLWQMVEQLWRQVGGG